jgi:predicted PurR-regulated permease PerM
MLGPPPESRLRERAAGAAPRAGAAWRDGEGRRRRVERRDSVGGSPAGGRRSSAWTPFRQLRPLITLAILLLVTVCLYWAKPVLMPIAFALMLTFLLTPPVNALRRVGVGRIGSVALVVGLALVLVTAVGWGISLQVTNLAHELPRYRTNIKAKIADLRAMGRGGALEKLHGTAQEVAEEMKKADKPVAPDDKPVPVVVEGEKTGPLSLPVTVGPLVEYLAMAGLVIVLVLFMLLQRHELRNRLIRLMGHGRLTITTNALDEVGERITRYLLMQTTVNGSFGLAIGLGLFFIGVPHAIVWGLLAAVLRYVPYLGSWIAALLPITLSLAVFPGWQRPLLVVALFIVIEVLIINFLEPWLYGHTVGVSEVALLVAMAFWTWLWGPIGLLLATPITACLVVLGRHIREMEFLTVFLGDEPVLKTDVSYYQRVLAGDQDEATEIVEAYLKSHSREALYDEVLVPALVHARHDRSSDRLTDDEAYFVLRATREVIEHLPPPESATAVVEAGQAPGGDGFAGRGQRLTILGLPARDEADELALLMFGQMLTAVGCQLEILAEEMLSAEMVSAVEAKAAAVVCIVALPPGGLTQTRYLCKRLRQKLPGLKILIGRWGRPADPDDERQALVAAGADEVGTRLMESQAQLLQLIQLVPPVERAGEDASEARPTAENPLAEAPIAARET